MLDQSSLCRFSVPLSRTGRYGIGWSADNSMDDPAFSTSLTRGDGRFCFLRAMCADRTARSSGVAFGGFARSVPAASDDEFIIRCFYTYFRCTARKGDI